MCQKHRNQMWTILILWTFSVPSFFFCFHDKFHVNQHWDGIDQCGIFNCWFPLIMLWYLHRLFCHHNETDLKWNQVKWKEPHQWHGCGLKARIYCIRCKLPRGKEKKNTQNKFLECLWWIVLFNRISTISIRSSIRTIVIRLGQKEMQFESPKRIWCNNFHFWHLHNNPTHITLLNVLNLIFIFFLVWCRDWYGSSAMSCNGSEESLSVWVCVSVIERLKAKAVLVLCVAATTCTSASLVLKGIKTSTFPKSLSRLKSLLYCSSELVWLVRFSFRFFSVFCFLFLFLF